MAAHKHLIGGEAYGVAHKPGDPVTSRAPKRKIEEWLRAGIIEEVQSPEEEQENQSELQG